MRIYSSLQSTEYLVQVQKPDGTSHACAQSNGSLEAIASPDARVRHVLSASLSREGRVCFRPLQSRIACLGKHRLMLSPGA